jgi:hypothetical protein
MKKKKTLIEWFVLGIASEDHPVPALIGTLCALFSELGLGLNIDFERGNTPLVPGTLRGWRGHVPFDA